MRKESKAERRPFGPSSPSLSAPGLLPPRVSFLDPGQPELTSPTPPTPNWSRSLWDGFGEPGMASMTTDCPLLPSPNLLSITWLLVVARKARAWQGPEPAPQTIPGQHRSEREEPLNPGLAPHLMRSPCPRLQVAVLQQQVMLENFQLRGTSRAGALPFPEVHCEYWSTDRMRDRQEAPVCSS